MMELLESSTKIYVSLGGRTEPGSRLGQERVYNEETRGGGRRGV